MNNRRIWAILILSTMLNVIAVFFLPDDIPIHYDICGNVDSWGTKYIVFMFTVIIYVLTILNEEWVKKITGDIKNCDKDEEKQKKKNLIKNVYYIGFLTELMLFVLNVIMVVLSYKVGKTTTNEIKLEFIKITIIIISILMILLGNYLPKCKRNSILGIRTRWSLQNDKNWCKMQKTGGRFFVIAGLVNVLATCLGDVENFLTIFFIIITMLTLVIFIYPFFVRTEH